MRERVLLVGASPLALRLAEALRRQPERYRLLGVVDEAPLAGALPAGVAQLGTLEGLGRILHEQRPHRVVLALTARRGRLPLEPLLKARLRGVAVEEGLELEERLLGKLAIEALPPSALIFSEGFRSSRLQRGLNRALSLLVAVLGLLALLPLFALIACSIVLESGPPVFFRQERVGLAGRRFGLLKFRSMRPAPGPASEWERDNGDRITRVGRVLRRYRLDELPQFINVLRGEMSLIGPRPHPLSNYELFSRAIPYYWIRATAMPGVTGWAQVRYGYANGLEEETEKMRYDLYYIKHTSLWLDLRILAETLKVVLLGSDASRARRASAPRKVVPITARTAARRAAAARAPHEAAAAPDAWRRRQA
ncbi:MAG: exopolysaccharide biosynthesis polyprenyl glycosylphosphotransferase [Vicinamibacteria bacterium]